MIDRRDFLKTTALASASSLIGKNRITDAQVVNSEVVAIHSLAPASAKTRLAVRELQSGLHMLNPKLDVRLTEENRLPGAIVLALAIEPSRFQGLEEYEIALAGQGVILRAASEQSLLYAVFDFLERQGLLFGIDGTTAPIEQPLGLQLLQQGKQWKAEPAFAVRGLLPWPDFLNCMSVYNDEDFKAYFAAMLRMRFNTFGLHVYTENEPGPLAESYLSFDFAGIGHRASLEDSSGASWGYLPQRTSTFKMGADRFFDSDTFGADATRLPDGRSV